MLKISIPKPCHEDWNKMDPNEQGRHCSSCAKTVVDFTGMSDDGVRNFFLNKKEERVCGRFKQVQLQQIVIDIPQNVFRMEMPIWKKFLVASLVVFSTTLFSCNTSIDGRAVQNGDALHLIMDMTGIRQVVDENIIVGRILPPIIDSIPKTPVPELTGTVAILPDTTEPRQLMGDVAFVPTDTVKPKKCEPMLMGKPMIQNIVVTGDTILFDQHNIKKEQVEAIKKKGNEDCDKKTYY